MSTNELSLETLLRTHAPHASERLHARVLALQPERESGRAASPRRSPRRLALVVLPAAVGLAVAAAVVDGALRSGTQPQPPVEHRVALGRAPSATVPAFGALPAQAGATAPPPPTPGVSSSRLAHTDASLRIRVASDADLSRATTRATRIATSLGGYASSVRYRTPAGGAGAAYIELRVPAQQVKAAIARLGTLGTIVSQQLSLTDLQARLERQTAQVDELRRRAAALAAAVRDPALPDAQRVLLQIRLAETRRALAQRLHARQGTLSSGATARISLVIGTEKAVVPVAHRGRLGRMLHSAVGFLGLEGMVALYALIVVSPFALAAALLWLWRRRSVERILSGGRI